MSKSDLTRDFPAFKELVYNELYEVHRMDQIGWKELSESAGYEGETSLKNIAQGRAHNLDFAAGLYLMKNIFEKPHSNTRLHRLSFNTKSHMMIPRPPIQDATTDMTQASSMAQEAITDSVRGARVGDYREMAKAYKALLVYASRIRAQVEMSQDILAKKEMNEQECVWEANQQEMEALS